MSLKLSKPVLIIGVIVVVMLGAWLPTGLELLRDTLASPWAHSLRGEPTLTGRWQGQLMYAGIGQRPFTLEIRHDPMDGHRGQYYAKRGAFDGTAEMTDEEGYRMQFEIHCASNRDSSKSHINLRDLNRKISPRRQPLVVELNGVWHGQTLELTGEYTLNVYNGVSNVWNSDWPSGKVSGTLSKP